MIISQSARLSLQLNWRRIVSMLALLTLLVTLAPIARTTNPVPRVQPALLAFAAQHPADQVAVIVQKLAQDTSLERMVAQLGGEVTMDLHIINAFAARLESVPERWSFRFAKTVATSVGVSG